jgi:GNAT superfamily N-acetyltransferase
MSITEQSPHDAERQERVQIQIRLARPEDLLEIAAVIEASLRILGAKEYSEEQIESLLRQGVVGDAARLVEDGTYFVALADGEIAGCGGWSRRRTLYAGASAGGHEGESFLDPEQDAARIRAFFVHPSWVRRGIGRRLLAESEAAARRAGFGRLDLAAMHTGVPLYASCGYRAVERLEATMPDGVPMSGILMRKELA